MKITTIIPIMALAVFLLLIFVFFPGDKSEENGQVKEKTNPYTFCEELIMSERLVSSQYPIPELDVLAEDVLRRGGGVSQVSYEGAFGQQALNFKTRIDEAFSQDPNFAGHYVLAEWGCGTNCQSHALVDKRDGKIISFGIGSEYGVKADNESKILITNPKENMPLLSESGMAPIQAAKTFARTSRDYYRLLTDQGTNESYLSLFCTESAGSHYLTQLDEASRIYDFKTCELAGYPTSGRSPDVCIVEEKEYKQAECSKYDVEFCPQECVICPPCLECSSISCQTQAFCASMGFDKNWYNSVRP